MKYRGKTVAIKCGQMFSLGKKASPTTAQIGNKTSAAITNAETDHTSGSLFLLDRLRMFVKSVIDPRLNQS
ncbi:hypothetical protein GCM10008927_09380 [Amylibacter ulvae]|uniref:Uncharacterized protein n=2 Tax=Paramylibacter ulvae TaxID=1651968 RepID=A0ABQ3CX08_9RHOB|nr:hypothetical protein GCM10008927_09380 [Amylibacter ulvae]